MATKSESKTQTAVIPSVATNNQLVALGLEAVQAVVDAAGKYMNVVIFVREHKVEKRCATLSLLQSGFTKSRASEVFRVANAPDKVFENYKAGIAGFKNTLNATRLLELETAGQIDLKDTEDVIDVEGAAREQGKAKGAKKAGSQKSRLLKFAMRLASGCAKAKALTFPIEWECGEFRVTVSKL